MAQNLAIAGIVIGSAVAATGLGFGVYKGINAYRNRVATKNFCADISATVQAGESTMGLEASKADQYADNDILKFIDSD